MNFNCFFRPKSVAILGAISGAGKVGHNFITNLIKSKYPGKIYPVHPGLREIMGMKIYPSIKDIPEKVDLLLIATPPPVVPAILLECAEKGIKAVILSSAGFAEGDEEGKELERKVVVIAREHGIRIMGPNTQGLIDSEGKLMICSVTNSPPPMLGESGVAYVCQTAFFYWDWVLKNPHLGLTKAVDLGNMCDVDHADVIDYLSVDPKIRVFALHIEGMDEGRKFQEIARKVTLKKPVIAMKTGRSPAGRRAISSHTGSLAGRDEIYNGSFRRTGIIRAIDMDELINFTKTFACLPSLPTGNRVGIITISGGAGTLAVDACKEFGLNLAELSETTIEMTKQVLPPWATARNPFDMFTSLKIDAQSTYSMALEAFSDDPNVDSIVVIGILTSIISEMSALNALQKYAESGIKKPTVVCGFRDEGALKQLADLETKGLPVYSSVRSAVKSLAAAYSRHQFLENNNIYRPFPRPPRGFS